MSYQALLFCPDEKTARVVTQVLSELEFAVEPCHEPFAAVKKLMAQHFDAIVVDCDSEQNAALLFKSARNSGSNQASLSVAMVEGQTGVAKAFRLGANLVLTKPIHVEQSKGTLRVARGLLRKGQAVKPAVASSLPELTLAHMSPVISASRPVAAPPVISASAFELDAEPTPQPDSVDAALLESMPDAAAASMESSQQSVPDTTPSKQYAWQPRSKPMAEPMASALRRAAEAAGKTEFENPASGPASIAQVGGGAAAATARAKEAPVSASAPVGPKPAAAAQPVRVKTENRASQDTAKAETWNSTPATQTAQAPSFKSLDDSNQFSSGDQSASAGGSKKILWVAVGVLAAAALGYFGWTKLQNPHSQSVRSSIAAETATTPSLQTSAPADVPAQLPAGALMPASDQAANAASSVALSSKPSAAVVGDGTGPKTPTIDKPSGQEGEVNAAKAPAAAKAQPSQPLVVKNTSPSQPAPEASAQEPEQAPALTSIASDTNRAALSGVVDTTAVNASRAPEQTLRLSQGVSQGLIIKKVQPSYPPRAMQMRLEGRVELQANISKTGSITGIRQLSGDRILGTAALDAVRQWKYKPYYLNGEPIEIQTQITVNFKLP